MEDTQSTDSPATHPEQAPLSKEEFKLLLARIIKEHPGAADLLCLMAFLAPQPLDVEVLLKHAKALPKRMRAHLAESGAAQDTVTFLHKERLSNTGDGVLSFTADNLERVRHKLKREQRREWARTATSFLLKAFPVQLSYENRIPECDALVDHALSAIDWAEHYRIAGKEAGNLANEVGLYLHGCGDYTRARDSLYKSLLLSQKALAPTDPTLATRWNNLGVVHQDLDDFPKARECFDIAVNLLMARESEIDEAIVQPFRNLYTVLDAMEEWESANEVAEKALKVFLDLYGFEHPHVGECLSLLGTLCHRLGKMDAAKDHFDQAILSVSCAQPLNEGDLAVCKRNYGLMLFESGEFVDAEEEFRGALELTRSFYKERHISIPTTLFDLGRALEGQGKRRDAEASYREGLSACQDIEGPDSLNQLPFLRQMRAMFAETGNHRGLSVCLARELAIKESRFGEGAPQLAQDLIRLGQTLERREKHTEAADCLRQALRIHEEHANLDPEVQASAHRSLGRVLQAQDLTEEAIAHFEQGLNALEEAKGAKSTKVARDSVRLGRILIENGQRLKGLGRFTTGLRIYEERLGIDHPKTIEIREEYQRLKKR